MPDNFRTQPTDTAVKWIFFDLDDTLWDFAANSLKGLRHIYDTESDLHGPFPTFDSFADVYHRINADLWRRYHRGEIGRDLLMNGRFLATLAEAPVKAPDNLMTDSYSRHLSDIYLHALGRQKLLVDGAEEVLSRLSRHFLIGLLSNGFREVQYDKLFNSGLDRFVQRMVLSDEIGIQKPDPRIFAHALRAVGATAQEVIMVGDNPEADIRGALDAGWRAIYFDKRREGNAPAGAPLAMNLFEAERLIMEATKGRH